jgi:hypothetical protein
MAAHDPEQPSPNPRKLQGQGSHPSPRFCPTRSAFVRAQCGSFLPDPAAELAVKEHHVLLDVLAADVQAIGGEVRVGVANRQAAQNRQFRRDSQLRADDFRIPRDRDFDARPQVAFGQGQRQVFKYMPTLRASAGPRSLCMQTMPTSGAWKNCQLRNTAVVCFAVWCLFLFGETRGGGPMRKIGICALVAVLAPVAVHAADINPGYCVYHGKRYAVGTVLTIRGKPRRCVSSIRKPLHKIWKPLHKNSPAPRNPFPSNGSINPPEPPAPSEPCRSGPPEKVPPGPPNNDEPWVPPPPLPPCDSPPQR